MDKGTTDLKQAMFQVSDGVIGAAILVVCGVLAGNWLDGKLHSSPWMVVILSMLGGGIGLFRLVRKAMLIGKNVGPDAAPGAAPSANVPLTPEQEFNRAESDAARSAGQEQALEGRSAKDLKKANNAFEFLDRDGD